VSAGASVTGSVDELTEDNIYGWAWDPDQPNTPIQIDIYDGDTLLATVPADGFRQDLLDAGMGNGNHVFHYVIPARSKDGQPHTIRVRPTGSEVDLVEPKIITLKSP
jgi:hypothetical protein